MSEIKGTIKRVNETNVISDKFQKTRIRFN